MQTWIAFTTLAALLPLSLADCNNFTVSRRTTSDTSFSTTSDRSYVVSNVVNCDTEAAQSGNTFPSSLAGDELCNATRCYLAVPPDYYVLLNRTLNVTSSSDAEQSIFDLIRDDFQLQDRLNFEQSWAYEVQVAASCMYVGDAGYWGFTPFYWCIEGSLSQCSGDDYPSDGTTIRACLPGTVNANTKLADGTTSFVQCSGCEDSPVPPNATFPERQLNGDGDSSSGASVVGVASWTVMAVTATLVTLVSGLLM